MSDDRLGSVAVSISVSELQWTPDIAPAVMDRIARDAIAYPEQFDRRTRPPAAAPAPPPVRPTASRAVGRLAVMAIVVLVILALVVVLAAASGPLTGTDGAVADDLHLSLTFVRESA